MGEKKYSIFIIDDHPLVRCGYTYLIEYESNLQVCGEAGSVDEALIKIRASVPDLVITDISLAGATGLELIKSVCAEWPSMPVLVVSMYEESDYAWRSFKMGARGYVVKREGTGTLIHAINTLLKGGVHLSEDMARTIVTDFQRPSNGKMVDPIDRLTEREMEIFQQCGQGLTVQEISETLHISTKTVDTHRASLRSKMNASSNAELVRMAVQWVSQRRTR
ncbi:MAG: response regulator transcription factor [Rhodothermales bacterium]